MRKDLDTASDDELEEAHPRPSSDSSNSLRAAQDQFILEWGRMSSSWGINRTMAQIHALLFVTGIPLEVNEIMDRLQISRGNASMNLRELMDWGVVRRFRQPGDRKDTYITETDPYQMFTRVVKERKRREMDPTVEAIREVLTYLKEDDKDPEVQSLRRRLTAILEIFELVDVAYRQIFAHETTLDEIKALVAGTKPSE
ncbi:MarR family transcriptional regulator [bacterium]|nr:MAG: MarR family transcriptional regulator [bacterium]